MVFARLSRPNCFALFLSLLLCHETQAWSSVLEHFTAAESTSSRDPSRRGAIRQTFAGIGAGLIATSYVQHAKAAPATAGEAVRRYSANLPGYGPTDVFYPSSWKGSWTMRREVVSNDNPSAKVFEYPVRFLQSVQEDVVVADRGFNEASLETVLRDSDAVQSVVWTVTNPNDRRLVFTDGKRKDIKVTKRATELTATTVVSSEFQRVSQDDARGIPVISARRVLTKWKMDDDGLIEALELVYDLGGGDPLASTISTNSGQQPKLLSKSRLRLES